MTHKRHRRDCPLRKQGRRASGCGCPIWFDGNVKGQRVRKSLRVYRFEDADEAARKLVYADVKPLQSERVTVEKALAAFLADCAKRSLGEATLRKYRHFGCQMQAFADQGGLKYLANFSLEKLTDFRASWPNRNVGALKKFELLRTLFAFCSKRHWIDDNPAKDLEKPKAVARPTLPFSREEMVRILSAAENSKDSPVLNERRLRALILLLRYSGLRIGDAVMLGKDRMIADKLFLTTSKAHVPVYVPLPAFVIEALESVSLPNLAHYFWTGASKPKTAISHWQAALKNFLASGAVGIENGHAHRFRDTFATELLLSGVLIERVAMLLGHESTRTTERHYRHWVKARQEQLEADVRKSWGDWLAPAHGTPLAHGQRSLVN